MLNVYVASLYIPFRRDSSYGKTTFNRLIGDGAEHRAELVSLTSYLEVDKHDHLCHADA